MKIDSPVAFADLLDVINYTPARSSYMEMMDQREGRVMGPPEA